MKLGALFPQREIGTDPIAIKDYGQAVEALGFEHLAIYEHVLGANPEGRATPWTGPYTCKHMFHEAFVLLGYLAAFTRRLVLMPCVLVLPQRQTPLVAKQAAEVDVLSGGRLRLGVGVGWNAVESSAMGQNFHTRGARIEEQIAVLRALWTQELVTFHGRWHTLDDVGLNPLPIQRPIPIWMGAEGETPIRRSGRLADGFITGPAFVMPNIFEQPTQAAEPLESAIALMRQTAQAAGRDASQRPIAGGISIGRRTPEHWARAAEIWRAAGATHFRINTMNAGLASPAEHIEALRRFKQVVPE